jgi:SPOR domain
VPRSRGMRPFYKVSIGTETRAEATALCNRIRAAGGACIVLRGRYLFG